MTTDNKVAIRESTAIFKPIERKEAAYLLRQVWPEAPDADILRAAIICAQYNLNPLMKHVALVKFGNKWEPVMEIKATRIIAQREHTYSYVENTPRLMTEQEQITAFGEVDKDNLVAVTILDEYGRRFPGYGRWPKNQEPYGKDKGNTKSNMAFIRAERNALDKMAPGELPSDIEVADGTYTPAVNVKQEIIEGKATFIDNTQKQIEELWPETAPAIEMITKEQSNILKVVPGAELGPRVKAKGWAAARLSELTSDQAAILIKELKLNET